jgi:hypothetical protein
MEAAQGIVAGEPQGPPGEGGQALDALRATWGSIYDIGTVTIAGKDGPVRLWVAIRLESSAPEPLAGSTAAALAAAIDADQAGRR